LINSLGGELLINVLLTVGGVSMVPANFRTLPHARCDARLRPYLDNPKFGDEQQAARAPQVLVATNESHHPAITATVSDCRGWC
jgi:hypothetical protein